MSDHTSKSSLLRVEGVNLSAFVFDTRDLSTNRGGSLMLLNAVKTAFEALGLKENDPAILSRGASSGLFRIDGDPAIAAQNVRKALAEEYPHATFVVDVIESEDFAAAREQTLAANRWRQMQAATLAAPPENKGDKLTKPACALDGLRAADAQYPAPNRNDDQDFISLPTHDRRKYGRKQKSAFYHQETGNSGLEFAGDFETICAGAKPLPGKLAVFYADGNKFGAKQAEHCRDETRQRAFDAYLRGARRKFLKDFLELAKNQSEWTIRDKGCDGKEIVTLRFETLLWGGDEFMFVMPASLGWRFVTLYFEKMSGLNLKEAPSPAQDPVGFPDVPLSHAAALVFCQHHSPIHRIKRLAKEQMAEFAKGQDRSRDSLMVVALESFDHLGAEFERAMAKRYSEIQSLEKMILAAGDGKLLHEVLSGFAGGVAALRDSETFPRSQLRGLVNEMLAKRTPSVGNFRTEKDAAGHPYPPRHFRNAEADDRAVLARLLPLFPDPGTLWLQLEELWDYALP